MDVMVAQSAGFCYGVKRAVDMARDTAHREAPCVMLGSIIHNANVVAELEALGMRKAESWQEVLPGETVVIRSHGEKKEVFEKLEELGARCVNATCPNVLRIQQLVAQVLRLLQAAQVACHHDEFIAAQACYQVALAQVAAQTPCDGHQQFVTHVVAVRVVHGLEAV